MSYLHKEDRSTKIVFYVYPCQFYFSSHSDYQLTPAEGYTYLPYQQYVRGSKDNVVIQAHFEEKRKREYIGC
jgi:hypothetical protein